MDAAVQRVRGTGAFIAREVARGNPRFAAPARENHAEGYAYAAEVLERSRDEFC